VTAVSIANVVLVILAAVFMALFLREKDESGFQKRRALRFEEQANNELAYSSKTDRDNDDLRNRLREQGKAWAARVKKARRK
jgi:hypothetical protein